MMFCGLAMGWGYVEPAGAMGVLRKLLADRRVRIGLAGLMALGGLRFWWRGGWGWIWRL